MKVSKIHGVYEVEIQTYSLRRDGAKRWIPSSRDVEQYVTELSFDSKDSIYVDANTLGTGRLVALLQRELPASWNITTSVTLKEDTTNTPINERKWEHILNGDRVLGSCSIISKKMTRLLQRPRRSNSMGLFRERVQHRIGGG